MYYCWARVWSYYEMQLDICIIAVVRKKIMHEILHVSVTSSPVCRRTASSDFSKEKAIKQYSIMRNELWLLGKIMNGNPSNKVSFVLRDCQWLVLHLTSYRYCTHTSWDNALQGRDYYSVKDTRKGIKTKCHCPLLEDLQTSPK